jgi:hypothetical protein
MHHALAGVAAPPVIALNALVAGSSSGCRQVDQGMLKAIVQNPEQYYVNVHTTAAAGTLAGHLEPAGSAFVALGMMLMLPALGKNVLSWPSSHLMW